MKWKKEFGHDGSPQKAVGKTIKSFRMREDREDFEFVFDDESELRIFGKTMHPSYSEANVKGHASASESAGGSKTAPPNDGGESDSEREADCCAPSCSALELDGVDHDIRSYFERDIEARYVAGIPSKIQSVRNQIELLQHLNNRQNSSNDSKQSKNNIEPQDAIGEFIRCSQMIFDGSGDFDCGFSDQRSLNLFMKLGVSLGILAETGHDLTNGFIKVSGSFVGHGNFLQNVQVDSAASPLDVPRLVRPFDGWVKLSSGQLIPVKDIEYIGALNKIEFQAPEHVKCYMTKNGRVYHLSDKEYAEICQMVEAANLG